jgi:hypothetical protein
MLFNGIGEKSVETRLASRTKTQTARHTARAPRMTGWLTRTLACALAIALGGACSTPPRGPDAPFPMDRYDQAVDAAIPPGGTGYREAVFDDALAGAYRREFVARFTGERSPWQAALPERWLAQLPALSDLAAALSIAGGRDDPDAGFRADGSRYPEAWYRTLDANARGALVSGRAVFDPARRAIATDNVAVRALPSAEPYYRNPVLAGEGPPFDYLQRSAIWAGTPLYILGASTDNAWRLVVSPAVVGWVAQEAVATVDADFVQAWAGRAQAGLAALVRERVPMRAAHGAAGQARGFDGYIGAAYPVVAADGRGLTVLAPRRTARGDAELMNVRLGREDAWLVGEAARPTPERFAQLARQMLGRPYRWGGGGFYNDCSAEMQNVFATFGIWLPRNSADQARRGARLRVPDGSPEDRMAFIREHGRPFATLLHVPGHVMLYIGARADGAPMTWQNIWGMSPADRSRRAVIGRSVLLPLLPSYQEDPELVSLLNKPLTLIFLDQPLFSDDPPHGRGRPGTK